MFWTVLCKEGPQGLRSATVPPGALASLASYRFPGNIRELESIVYAALLKAEDGFVQPDYIHAVLHERKRIGLEGPRAPLAPVPSIGASKYRRTSPPAEERAAILRALARARGVKSRAAENLGMSRRTLYRMLHGYTIDEDEWRESES